MNRTIRSRLPFYMVILLWGLGSGMLMPVLPLYVRSLGFTIEEWGYLVMVYAVSTFLFEWAWGALSDRIDRRVFIAAGLLSGAALIPLYTLRVPITVFYVLQFLRGALFIMVGPAVKSLVSDMSSGGIGLSMGMYSSVRRLGSVLGPIAGTIVAQALSYESALHLYSLIYIIGAATTLFFIKGVPPPAERSESPSLIQDCRTLFTTTTITILFAISVIVYMGGTVIGSYLPIYALEVIGMSTVGVGALFSIGNVAGFLTTPVFGWISDRYSRGTVVLTCFVLSTVAMFSLSLARTNVQLALLLMVFTVCFSPLTPLLLAMLTDATPPGLLGTSMGIYSTFENLGIVFTPPVYSLIWSAYSPSAIFVFGAITQVLGILLVFYARKRLW